MSNFKILFSFIILTVLFSCGKNKETEEHQLEQQKEPNYEQTTPAIPESQKNDTIYKSKEDSVRAVKNSILRKQKFKKKEETGGEEETAAETSVETPIDNTAKTPDNSIPSQKPPIKKAKAPSFVYIKKILNECEIGKVMTQEDLQRQFNIPKEAIQLVKTVTKISDNELDIKWKTTWLVEKMSDAKFNDGRLKVRFEKNRMYTSGGAIGIKYEKKLYTDLYLIGRSAHIPTVKGYYWQIGKD